MRRLAAIEVQRIWRGSVTRKVLDDEWKKWIIKWPWDKPGTIVEVRGNSRKLLSVSLVDLYQLVHVRLPSLAEYLPSVCVILREDTCVYMYMAELLTA